MATTIDSMTGFTICSPFFENNPTLELFPVAKKQDYNNRVALLYGKNGSGKSTIAQGFRELSECTNPRSVTVQPLSESARIVISPNGRPEKIHVFDEAYVEANIRVKQSSLGSIVLLGEQTDIEEELQETKDKLEDLNDELESQNAQIESYNDPSKITSPEYWINSITSMLQRSNGWAETLGINIRHNKNNAKVNFAEINRIGLISPKESRDEIQAEFNRRYTLYNQVDADATEISIAVNPIYIDPEIESLSIYLLEKPLEKPQLTDREEKLLKIFGIEPISRAKEFLLESINTDCPLCLQPISDEYRSKIINSINAILNREVEEFREQLKKLLIESIPIDDYEAYQDLAPQEFLQLRTALEKFNSAISIHNATIQTRIDNVFSPVIYTPCEQLMNSYHEVNQVLSKLEVSRLDYNRIVIARSKEKTKLTELNDMLAHYEIMDAYHKYLAQKSELDEAINHRTELIDQQRALEEHERELNSKRERIDIAVDKINEDLAYIFYSKERLRIELSGDGYYTLKAFGKPVQPNKISCGERNAIALCYFFVDIAREHEADSLYNKEMFLVIDDPISSFDIGNRVGMISFLRKKLSNILTACPTTKLLLMTHDIKAMYDLVKAFGEISDTCAATNMHAEYACFELLDKSVSQFRYKSYNEYTRLLESIYAYACSPTDELELYIGNAMRRVLEAFSTFLFKTSIEKVSLDKDVLKLIPNEAAREYFRNSMYRLILNNESHLEEPVRTMPEDSIFKYLSTIEKQRTAKDVLCFMYKISSTHILAHIPTAKADLESWWNDICDIVSVN